MTKIAKKSRAKTSYSQKAYLGRYPYNLINSGNLEKYYQLLTNFEFIQAKINHPDFGVQSLIEDYDLLDKSEVLVNLASYQEQFRTLKLIQETLRVSAHILTQDKTQLAVQLWGRIQCFELRDIQKILEIAKQSQTIWLRPLTASLTRPGGRLLRTLSGHSCAVTAVAVTPNGKQVISASTNKTVKVWDLATGYEIFPLPSYHGRVQAVAVTHDSKKLISASINKTLKIWDLATGDEISTLSGHSAWINGIAVTPDNKQVVSCSLDKTLIVWDLATGNKIFTLSGHRDSVNAIAITPDGLNVVSASDDNTLKVWNLRTGKEILSFNGHISSVVAVAIALNGKRIISASSNNHLKIWNLDTGKVLFKPRHHLDPVIAVAVIPDGFRVVSHSANNALTIWNPETGEELFQLTDHSASVNAVVFTQDGKQLISASDDNTLKVWNLETKEELLTPTAHSNSVNAVAVTPNGKQVISASADKTLKVWNLETRKEVITLTGHTASVNAIAITPDGKRVISASDDKTLKVWILKQKQTFLLSLINWITIREVRNFAGHVASVKAVTITADGKQVISAGDDKTLKVWDSKTGKTLVTLPVSHESVNEKFEILYSKTEEKINLNLKKDLKSTSDGKWWIFVSNHGENIKVMEQGEERRSYTLKNYGRKVKKAILSLDGKIEISDLWQPEIIILELSNGLNIEWDMGYCQTFTIKYLGTGEELKLNLFGKNFVVTSDLKWLIIVEHFIVSTHKIKKQSSSFSVDKSVSTLHLDSYGHLSKFSKDLAFPTHKESINTVAIISNGTQVISGSSDTTLKIWNLFTGEKQVITKQEQHTLTGHSLAVRSVAITPNGKQIVSASDDKSLKVWNIESGKEPFTVTTLSGHGDSVRAVAVNPNGRQVVSGSDDNTLRVWDLESQQVIAKFTGDSPILCCAVAPDGVTIVAGDASGRVHFLRLEGMGGEETRGGGDRNG